jgi:hypothetical protein
MLNRFLTEATSKRPAPVVGSPESPELTAFKKAIRKKYDLKEGAFAAHDVEPILTQFYAEDVISVGGSEGIFIGREQLRPLYNEVINSGTVKIESFHSYVNGNAGWDWADFNVSPADAKVAPFTFAFVFLWSNLGGEWMCKGDFYTLGSHRTGIAGISAEPR